MEILQLRQFKAIAEFENMTRAAASLYVSQPTLSAMLKKLETEIGLPLFVREKNRLKLTEAGKILLRHADMILETEENARIELERYRTRADEFRVGFCDPGPMWYYSPRYNMANPRREMKAEVYPDPAQEISCLLSEKYELIISRDKTDHPRIESIPLVHEYLFLDLPEDHPLTAARSVSLREARIPRILFLRVPGVFSQNNLKYLEGLRPDTQVELCDDIFLYNYQVQNTDIPTISTRLTQGFRNWNTSRVLVPVSDPELSIDYHVSFLKKNHRKLQKFLDWIRNT